MSVQITDIMNMSYHECAELVNDQSAKIDDLQAELDRERERVADLEERLRWVPVSERLPITFGWHEVWDASMGLKDKRTFGFWDYDEQSPDEAQWLPLDSRDDPDSMIVTHWRERPEPPTDTTGGER